VPESGRVFKRLIMPRASLADLDKAGFGDFDHFPASGTAGQARIVFYGPELPKTVVRTFLAAVLALRQSVTEGRREGRRDGQHRYYILDV